MSTSSRERSRSRTCVSTRHGPATAALLQPGTALSARDGRRVRARISEDRRPSRHGRHRGRRPVCRAPARRLRLSRRARSAQAGRRISAARRAPARDGESQFHGAAALDDGGAVPAAARPEPAQGLYLAARQRAARAAHVTRRYALRIPQRAAGHAHAVAGRVGRIFSERERSQPRRAAAQGAPALRRARAAAAACRHVVRAARVAHPALLPGRHARQRDAPVRAADGRVPRRARRSADQGRRAHAARPGQRSAGRLRGRRSDAAGHAAWPLGHT